MLSPDPSTLTNGSIYLVFENEMSPGRSSETSTLDVKGQQHFGSNQWQPPFARSWLRQVRSACLSGWNKGGMGLQETRWNSCSKGYLLDQLNGVGEVWQWVFLTRQSRSSRYTMIWPVQVPWYRWGPAFGWSSTSPLWIPSVLPQVL